VIKYPMTLGKMGVSNIIHATPRGRRRTDQGRAQPRGPITDASSAIWMLEHLYQSSTHIDRYIAKGGMLTPLAYTDDTVWGPAIVAVVDGNDTEANVHFTNICKSIAQAKQVFKSVSSARYTLAMENLNQVIMDRTQTASVIGAISFRHIHA
jgi:hypothetical protein